MTDCLTSRLCPSLCVWPASVDFLHPKDGSLNDKPLAAPGRLRIVKPLAAAQQRPQRSHNRRQPATSSTALSASVCVSPATPCESLSASQCDSSLSLTSTSTFPSAYTAPASLKQPGHTRRSASSSALPSPTRSSTAAHPAAAPPSACTPSQSAASSPQHQRAHTAEELSSQPNRLSEPATPRAESTEHSLLSGTPPQSPSSARAATPPPTVRRAASRSEQRESSSDSQADSRADNEMERTRRMGDSSSVEASRAKDAARLEEGEEESEELTNTTLADASLPESDDGDERRRRGHGGEGGGSGSGSGGGGGGAGGSQPVNEAANDSTDAISDILDFMRQSILALTPSSPAAQSAPRVSLQQLVELPASALLARYKTALAPVMCAHSEAAMLRDQVSALHVKVAEMELGALRECKRQVEAATAEVEARYSEQLRRAKKDKRDRKADKKARSGAKGDTSVTASTASATAGRHNNTLNEVSYINASLSFHDMSIDPTLSLTTDMLEPRTVTVTLSALDLATPTPHSGAVTLALFSSRLACHSLWNFVGQTESRLPAAHSTAALAFERRLTMRDVKTWHARDKLRVSAYWVAAQSGGGEERKEMMGQVECDTYRLFTAFGEQPQQAVPWEALKAQETADAIAGFSSRQLCVPLLDEHGVQCANTRLLLQAHITPPLTCDSYPPSPERVRRAGRHGMGAALHADSTLNLSLINDSLANFNHSLAAPSFIEQEPLSPILPAQHSHASSSSKPRGHETRSSTTGPAAALERTQRQEDTSQVDATNTTARASECAATQCDSAPGVECGIQTDAPVAAQRLYCDACTMTDEPAAPVRPLLTVCPQTQLSIDPVLQIVTRVSGSGSGIGSAGRGESARGGASSCDNSPVVFHQEASACSTSCSPSSPPAHSSACSSAASSPVSASQAADGVAAVAAALPPVAASPLQATLVSLSNALSVPFPLAQAKLSTACQQSLHRTLGLLRRQYSSSLQWFLDTAAPANSHASATTATKAGKGGSGLSSGAGASALKPTWNPSINPTAPSRLLSSIRLHSHWQPDASVTSCSHCASAFSLLKRKHHCRLCGSTACDECSKKCVELGEVGLPGPQRVCDVCEMVWSAGKGLKALGMPVVLLEQTGVGGKEDDSQQSHKAASGGASTAQAAAAAASGRGRVKGVDDSRQVKASRAQQEEELDISAAPLQPAQFAAVATPTLSRTARVRPTPAKRSADSGAAAAASCATPGTVRRVTRSAAKENANTINVPAAIPEASSKRTARSKVVAAAAANATHSASTGKALRA